jgi:hypothetical protein
MTQEQKAKRLVYHRNWTANKRATDPVFKAREREASKRYEAAHPNRTPEQKERARLWMAKRRSESPELRERGREYARKWGQNNKERRNLNLRKYRLLTKYGMTMADFDAMLTKQDGLCAICRVKMTPPASPSKAKEGKSSMTVDHCHSTGRVRGILCQTCNLALGMFKDSIVRVRYAVAYLEAFEEKDNPS